MRDLAAHLSRLLGEVRRPGDFYASGMIDAFAPRIEVEGVGPLALPLLPVQAEQLIAAAERAPYGRGEETLVDTAVRRTWQIGAGQVRVGGRHWPDTFAAILARVTEGLGLSQPPKAELYKLLIYDRGSFFVEHRDTEKAPGMFATLVIVLPGDSIGGDLIVRHQGREARLGLRGDEPSTFAFAAFYADCVHEVLPVTDGCRVTLVFNLLRQRGSPRPEPPNYDREQAQIATVLRKWASQPESAGTDAVRKLIYPLEHAYTQAELGFDALKGADAAAAGVLAVAADRSDCDLHLALLSIAESGAAEYVSHPGSRRGRWSDQDDLEAGEVFDRFVTLADWRRPDGEPSPLPGLPAEDHEISPPDALDDLVPDEEHFREATGNEGASFERTYRRAALVLWPRARFLAVLSQAGSAVTMPYLDDLATRWVAEGGTRESPLWAQAHELAGHVVAGLAGEPWQLRSHERRGAGGMLSLLSRLGDHELIATLLDSVAAAGSLSTSLAPSIIDALAPLPAEAVAARIDRLVAATAALSLGACADLLRRAAELLPVASRSRLAGAAAHLVRNLPDGDAVRSRPDLPYAFSRPALVPANLVFDAMAALVLVDPDLARSAADHVLARPDSYALDAVLVPATVRLVAVPGMKGETAVERLRTACLAHLDARIAKPLEPPADLVRDAELRCTCPNCRSLSAFLADPVREAWTLRAVEHDRAHVEETIRMAKCDLDCKTERKGRPYSLICTKNQASYDRRVEQRRDDQENRTRLAR